METSGGRVMRYAHNFGSVLDVPPQAAALLAVLMLRGAQTVGELRINSERLHRFADISSVEAFLQELAERSAGALVTLLPRQPGSREPRWAHLLSGPPELPTVAAGHDAPTATETVAVGELAALRANVAQMRVEIDDLKLTVEKLCKELGISGA